MFDGCELMLLRDKLYWSKIQTFIYRSWSFSLSTQRAAIASVIWYESVAIYIECIMHAGKLSSLTFLHCSRRGRICPTQPTIPWSLTECRTSSRSIGKSLQCRYSLSRSFIHIYDIVRNVIFWDFHIKFTSQLWAHMRFFRYTLNIRHVSQSNNKSLFYRSSKSWPEGERERERESWPTFSAARDRYLKSERNKSKT